MDLRERGGSWDRLSSCWFRVLKSSVGWGRGPSLVLGVTYRRGGNSNRPNPGFPLLAKLNSVCVCVCGKTKSEPSMALRSQRWVDLSSEPA